MLDQTTSDMNAVPSLTGRDQPIRIKREDVESLYRRFNLNPYWES